MKLQLFIWVIMGAAFYAMWWANKQYKGKGVAWGRPLAALCGICSIGLALISMGVTCWMPQGPSVSKMMKKHQKFQYVAYKTFGQELAKRHPGASILLIKRYLITRSEKARKSHQMRIDAFKDGLNGKATIEVTEEATSGSEGSDEEADMSKSEMKKIEELTLTAERLDDLIQSNPDCDLVVSLLGLPSDMEAVAGMKLWKMKDDERPALALADANVHYLKSVIESGFISVILHRKPIPIDPDKPLPPTEPEIFDTMYMLITKDSLEKVTSEFPKLFASE